MTTEERKLFRLHVGGLPPNISAEDIRTRFRHFGDVLNVEIILEKFPVGEQQQCRGFAFFSLLSTDSVLDRFLTTYNGCSWRGRKLHISIAQPDFELRRQKELAASL
jgi:RNA recognition motif-containing protein|uniref:RRM domain-containing protein n=1 Tax=Ostreococcus sp. 'lucimarinus' TaxID=242159 RepID=A0A7R9T6A1_9CHLO|mmetsp:Transcript_919/g.3847  ORF Transcript_919/g.3847 Transcript_919/m.3847 type:complete len:107 (+) Transcript_919:321-641(+)